MTTVSERRAWTILRQRLAADVAALPLVWGVFVLAVALLVAGLALLRAGGLESSAWEQAAQLARWYAGAVGVYLTAVYLPLYVTHGFTRREFASQLPALVVAFAGAFALCMTLGYAVETLAYRALGWSQALSATHLYTSPTQYPLVLTEFLLLGAAWTVAGAVLGGAFYRSAALGLALVPAGLLMVNVVETAAGPRYFGPLPAVDLGWVPVLGSTLDVGSPAAAALVTAGVLAVGLALVWVLVRDLPVRSKAA